MLASIDSPQGDQAAATAAVIAAAQPRTSSAVRRAPLREQAGVVWSDPRRGQPLVDPTLLLDRIAEQRRERVPGRRDALAADRAVLRPARSTASPAPRSPSHASRRHHDRDGGRRDRAQLRALLAVGAAGDDHRLQAIGQPVLAERLPEARTAGAAAAQEREQRRRSVQAQLDRVAGRGDAGDLGGFGVGRGRPPAAPAPGRGGTRDAPPRARDGAGSRRGCAAARPRARRAARAAPSRPTRSRPPTRPLLPGAAWPAPAGTGSRACRSGCRPSRSRCSSCRARVAGFRHSTSRQTTSVVPAICVLHCP